MFAQNKASAKYGRVLGIDIGTTAIKVVEIERGGQSAQAGKPKLITYGIGELHHFVEKIQKLSSYDNQVFETVVASLRLVLQHAGVTTRNAILAIPSTSSYTTFIELPSDEVGGYGKRMVHEIERYIPFPIPDVKFEWFKIDDWADTQGRAIERFLLIAVQNREIEWYERIISAAGLRVVKSVFDGAALANAFGDQGSLPAQSGESRLLIDIGARSSALFVVRGGMLTLCERLDFAGGAITQSIAEGLGVTIERADELKMRRGLSSSGAEYELTRVISSSLDIFVNAVRKAKEEYMKRYEVPLKNFSLLGGTSRLAGLGGYLEKETDMTYRDFNVFPQVTYPEGLVPILPDLEPRLSLALAASLTNL